MLLRVRKYGRVEPAVLAERSPVPLATVMVAAREVAERLAPAREESLAELLGDWWGPDRPTDLVHLVRELTGELCGSERGRPHEARTPARTG